MNQFTSEELFDLRVACSEMRQKFMEIYLEAQHGKGGSVMGAFAVYEGYSTLYNKLVVMTQDD